MSYVENLEELKKYKEEKVAEFDKILAFEKSVWKHLKRRVTIPSTDSPNEDLNDVKRKFKSQTTLSKLKANAKFKEGNVIPEFKGYSYIMGDRATTPYGVTLVKDKWIAFNRDYDYLLEATLPRDFDFSPYGKFLTERENTSSEGYFYFYNDGTAPNFFRPVSYKGQFWKKSKDGEYWETLKEEFKSDNKTIETEKEEIFKILNLEEVKIKDPREVEV